MKRVLITGKTSYIGTNLKSWLEKDSKNFEVEIISVRGENWKTLDFSKYDAVVHAAAIVHKIKFRYRQRTYNKVNSDLTLEIANKAKSSGVKHFIFLSSMSVFGDNQEIINTDSFLNPKTSYAKSKLDSEKRLVLIRDSNFLVSIVRPPLVYGKNSKGNFNKLVKLSRFIPIFPEYENSRSMIFILNLNVFLKTIIDRELGGYFHPQNDEFVSTLSLISSIRHMRKLKIIKMHIPLSLIKHLKRGVFSKIFGDLKYDKEISDIHLNYNEYDFESSMNLSLT